MSYDKNPYMVVGEESEFDASRSTLVGGSKTHYKDDSLVGAPKYVP
jgi:hypothetical protein